MPRYAAVLDACVLVPVALADTLLRVAEKGLYRHVVAAAIRGGAQTIVTANVDDFPADALGQFELEAVHPDTFLLDQLDLSPPTVLQVIREQAAATRRPLLTAQDLAVQLSRSGVPGFADEILRLMSAPLDSGT